jgi:MoxR-like ATPase
VSAPLDVPAGAAGFREQLLALRRALATVVVGQDEAVLGVLTALLAGGHALLEGPPGTGKTLLSKAVARLCGLQHSRIQFTPDLLPSDILGGAVLRREADGTERAQFRPGPLFANLVLADEVNRASPRTQAALLEAMEERQVTEGGLTHALEEPFVVLATQNPHDEGTYPIPDSQLDRFLVLLRVEPATAGEIARILEVDAAARLAALQPLADRAAILALRAVVAEVVVAPELRALVAAVAGATDPTSATAPAAIQRTVRAGVSPRGAQALLRCARVRALAAGRHHVAAADVRAAAPAALRHRLLLRLAAAAEGVSCDALVVEALEAAGARG